MGIYMDSIVVVHVDLLTRSAMRIHVDLLTRSAMRIHVDLLTRSAMRIHVELAKKTLVLEMFGYEVNVCVGYPAQYYVHVLLPRSSLS